METPTMSSQESTFKSILNRLSIPTLEELSIVTLAIGLLENEEIKKIYTQHFSAEWVEDSLSHSTVCKLASICKSLQLPDMVQAKLVSGFHWIREQYFNWISFVVKTLPQLQSAFQKKLDYITYIINSVKWCLGVIDKRKSMQQIFLLKNEVKDDATLSAMFNVGTIFCLEDDLKILWGKMSDAEKNKLILNYQKLDPICFYWICKMKGDVREFMKSIPDFSKENKNLKPLISYKDPNNYALVLHIFKGNISGVKYLSKLANVDIEYRVRIIKIFLKEMDHNRYVNYSYWQKLDEYADKLYFLLKDIQDEGILNKIFHEFFQEFLKISIKYWLWHKFFFILLQIFVNSIDRVLLFDLITQLFEDVKTEKANIFELKMLWKNIPKEARKSFYLYISTNQKDREVRCFWEHMTIELLDMFLKDEELRISLTPYENYGISLFILRGRYDLIEFWLQKCLVSEEAIISYFENFNQTKSVEVLKTLQSYPINRVIEFLDWAFKYDDFMNKDEIIKVIDQAISKNFLKTMLFNLYQKNWENLKTIMDWMINKQKDEYKNALVHLKQKTIEEVFRQIPTQNYFNCMDFKSFLCAFLSYGVEDFGKIKVIMSGVDVNEGEICSNYLKNNFALIDNYLKFLEGNGKDIFLLKKSVFYYIFTSSKESDLNEENYCENMRKLLYWHCENDEEMKTKLEEIKKEIIKEHAFKSVLKCLRSKWDIAMNNILKILFEGKLEDEEWSKMLFDLKMKVVEKLNGDELYKEKSYYDNIVMLINYGKENKNIREGNWDVKKSFIESWIKNIQAKIIVELILKSNFLCSLLEGDEGRTDFKKMLRDLKKFLVNKVMRDFSALTCVLLGNIKSFSDFLNWNNFDEAFIQDLKRKMFDEKGVHCCLHWINNDKVHNVPIFFDWFSTNSNCDSRSKILTLKRNVLNEVVVRHSIHWNDENFKRLDEFLLLDSRDGDTNLKSTLLKNYFKLIVKGCSQCLIDGYLSRVTAFIKWAGIEGGEPIKNFKRNILVNILSEKILNSENNDIWRNRNWSSYFTNNRPEERLNFCVALQKFLYEYDNPESAVIASMKLDVLETHFIPVFEKLFQRQNQQVQHQGHLFQHHGLFQHQGQVSLKGFLKMSFDVHMTSGECFSRAQRLIREIFEKYGREYCMPMLIETDFASVIADL